MTRSTTVPRAFPRVCSQLCMTLLMSTLGDKRSETASSPRPVQPSHLVTHTMTQHTMSLIAPSPHLVRPVTFPLPVPLPSPDVTAPIPYVASSSSTCRGGHPTAQLIRVSKRNQGCRSRLIHYILGAGTSDAPEISRKIQIHTRALCQGAHPVHSFIFFVATFILCLSLSNDFTAPSKTSAAHSPLPLSRAHLGDVHSRPLPARRSPSSLQ